MSLLRPTTTGCETFIRNIIHGRKWLKEYGVQKRSEVFHSVDVSIGHSQLPQLLNLAGYKYYRGWRPQGALDAKGIPREFIWKGTDGSSIICSRGTYAGLWQTDYLNENSFTEKNECIEKFYKNELADIISHTSTGIIWLPFGMDDTLPMKDFYDNPVNMDALMIHLKTTTGVDIKYSTAGSFFMDLSGEKLTEYNGILDPCDVAYNIPTKGDKGLWLFRSSLDTMITKAETLWTMASSHGSDYPFMEIERAWENLLFISGHAMEYTFSEDYSRLYNLAVQTSENVAKLIKDALVILCEPFTFSPGANLLVNSLEYSQEGIFSIFSRETVSQDIRLCDCNQNPVDFQIVGASEILVDTCIPAFGINVIQINNCAEKIGHTVLPEHKSIKTVIDSGKINVSLETGIITGINKLTFDLNALFGKLIFTEIVISPDDAWLNNHRHGTQHHFLTSDWLLIENGPLRWKYSIKGTIGPAEAEIEITLLKNSSVIGFDIILDCQKKSNGFFSISFPASSDPDIKAGIPFGFEPRPVRSEPYGKQTDIDIDNLERLWPSLFYANGWISYNYNDIQFSFIGERLPSYYWYNSNEKNISIILTRTFNLSQCNDWMKQLHKYHECQGKSHFKFSVIIDDSFDYTKIFAMYKKIKYQPEHIEAQGGIKCNQKYTPDFEIKSEFCFITAMHKEADSTIIRIFNTSDSADSICITTKNKIYSCRIVDFNKNTTQRNTSLNRNAFSMTAVLKKYEVITLEVKFNK